MITTGVLFSAKSCHQSCSTAQRASVLTLSRRCNLALRLQFVSRSIPSTAWRACIAPDDSFSCSGNLGYASEPIQTTPQTANVAGRIAVCRFTAHANPSSRVTRNPWSWCILWKRLVSSGPGWNFLALPALIMLPECFVRFNREV